ncbi:NAD(P)H-quinone oxidoreductase subunit I, chloroplastic [subsurface metagenome]
MSKIKGINKKRLKGNPLRPEGEISRRELLKRLSPFGKVELDTPQCTGCGLCALECPTDALTVSLNKETGAFQLLFRYDHCLACSCCVEICPEKCLRVERILELDKMDSQSVLFEDEIVRCSECGSPVGSRAMINSIKAKVLAAGQVSSSQFELCPECKAKVQLSRLRT